jgi:hypothetical protein
VKTIGGQEGTRTPDTLVAGPCIETTYPLVIRNVVSSLDRRRAKIVVTVNGRGPQIHFDFSRSRSSDTTTNEQSLTTYRPKTGQYAPVLAIAGHGKRPFSSQPSG